MAEREWQWDGQLPEESWNPATEVKSESVPPRRWERLKDPDEKVKAVRLPNGQIARRMDEYYWALPGYQSGVSWAQILRWGPVEEVTDTPGPICARVAGSLGSNSG